MFSILWAKAKSKRFRSSVWNQGLIKAVGKLKYASKEIFVAEANLYNSEGKEIGFGTGNFTRSKIVLSEEIGYK